MLTGFMKTLSSDKKKRYISTVTTTTSPLTTIRADYKERTVR